jgi:hypothetical protein
MKIGEMFVQLGFRADQTKLKDFISAVGELNMQSVMSTLGIKGMYDTIWRIMDVAHETALGVHAFGAETGLSTKKMQQWSYFAEEMGVKSGEVEQSLRTLQSHLAGLKMGTDTSLLAPFAILNQIGAGITGEEDPFELLEKTGRALKNLAPEYRRMVVEQMGLSSSMLMVLDKLDSEEWKNQVYVTREQTEALMQYHKIMTRLGVTFKMLMVDISRFLIPIVSGWMKIGQAVTEAIRAHQILLPIIIAVATWILMATGALAPWAVMLSAIVLAVGLIADNWERVADAIKKAGDAINPLKPMSPGGMFNPLGGLGIPALGLLGGGNKNTTNTFNFKIFSNDPEEAARKTKETLRQAVGDADSQSPLGDN